MALKKAKRKFLTSDAARALVQAKHDAMTDDQHSAHGRLMSEAYWLSPAGLAKRRAVIEKKISALQAKLAELTALEKSCTRA
jgi:hypothetical protein